MSVASFLDIPGGLSGLRYFPAYNFLVSPTWYLPACLLYASAAYLSSRWPKPASGPETAKLPMQVYNLVQIIVCGYMTLGLGSSLLQAWDAAPNTTIAENVFALNAVSSADTEYYVLIHFLTKFLDMFDTWFIVTRGKSTQLSFLHVFHHATIGPVWGLVLGVGQGSTACLYGALINSFTHVLMYSHYLYVSTGRRNPWKRYLTTFQIGQFYSCVAQALLVYLQFGSARVPGRLCLLQLGYHLIMITLFSDFYSQAFAKGKVPACPKGKTQ